MRVSSVHGSWNPNLQDYESWESPELGIDPGTDGEVHGVQGLHCVWCTSSTVSGLSGQQIIILLISRNLICLSSLQETDNNDDNHASLANVKTALRMRIVLNSCAGAARGGAVNLRLSKQLLLPLQPSRHQECPLWPRTVSQGFWTPINRFLHVFFESYCVHLNSFSGIVDRVKVYPWKYSQIRTWYWYNWTLTKTWP